MMSDEMIERVRAALYANLRIEPVPHRMYDWRIEAESIDEAARAAIEATTVKGDGLVEWLRDCADTAEEACTADGDNEVYARQFARLRQAADTITTLKGEIERREELYRKRLRRMRPGGVRSDDYHAGYRAAVDEALVAISSNVVIPQSSEQNSEGEGM